MKPPKVIFVGPHDVRVKSRKRLSSDILAGEFDEANTDVLIRKSLSLGMRRDTLLHEALHAVIYLAGLRNALSLDHDREETLVVTITPWVLALLRDNPTMVEFLMENREREY